MLQKLGMIHQVVNPLFISYVYVVWLNKQIVIKLFPWKYTFVIPCIAHYSLPDRFTKPPIWLYSHPFHPHLCCYSSIKTLPNRLIYNTNLIFDQYISHPPSILDAISTRFLIFYISLYSFRIIGKFYNSPSTWYIENGVIVWCDVPKIQIWINPWRFVGGNWHTYGKRCTSLKCVNNWYLIRVNPILTSPS